MPAAHDLPPAAASDPARRAAARRRARRYVTWAGVFAAVLLGVAFYFAYGRGVVPLDVSR